MTTSNVCLLRRWFQRTWRHYKLISVSRMRQQAAIETQGALPHHFSAELRLDSQLSRHAHPPAEISIAEQGIHGIREGFRITRRNCKSSFSVNGDEWDTRCQTRIDHGDCASHGF